MFRDSAIIVSLITVFLYCAGTVAILGYCQFYNLDSDVLGDEFHKTLFLGFINCFNIFLIPIEYFLTGLFFLIVQNAIFPSYSIIEASVRLLKVIDKNLFGRKSDANINIYKFIRNFFIFFICFVLFVYPLSILWKEGYKTASEQFKNIQDNSLVDVKINDSCMTLSYLMCGSKQCAALDKNAKKIYYFSQENGFSFYSKINQLKDTENR